MYESRTQKPLPRHDFVQRLVQHVGIACGLLAVSLGGGMLGYMTFEHLSALDAFLNASMLLGGMGPVDAPKTAGGKFFEGTYALFSGLVVVATTGLILAPVLHRIMHGLHVPDEEDEEHAEAGKGRAPKRARGGRQAEKAGPAA